MTISQLISDRYNIRHAREGGYPVFKTTFYDFIKLGIWILFVICYLGLGIFYIQRINFNNRHPDRFFNIFVEQDTMTAHTE
jgi:hypothetical protein